MTREQINEWEIKNLASKDGKIICFGDSLVAVYDGSFCHFVRNKEDWSIEKPEITKLPKDSERFYLLGAGRVYDLKNRRVVK